MIENKIELLNNPYGQVSYETFRNAGLAFADKSSLIESLDNHKMTPYPVLLRPRRFGKSTFVQMLKCFYDISYRDRYEEIFSKTDIYKKNLQSHNSFHVINFNFSGVSGVKEDTLIRSFIIAV
ncbi:AAA family ATPase, partial [uncultured Ruminobacter sp.]